MASELELGSNVYCTLDVADGYHDDHHDSGQWDSAEDDTKNRALLSATRLLDQHVVWRGLPRSTTQALAWPRDGLTTRTGERTSDYPIELQRACAELARGLIVDAARTQDSALETGRTGVNAGGVSLSFDGTGRAKVLPDSVYYLLPSAWISHVRQRPLPGRSLSVVESGRW